jgi:hypothetical protein
MDREELMDRVDAIVRHAKRARAAQIDAGACQTSRDFDAWHTADDVLAASLDALRADLVTEEARDAAHRARCEVTRYQAALAQAQKMLTAAEASEKKHDQAHQAALAARIALDTQTHD